MKTCETNGRNLHENQSGRASTCQRFWSRKYKVERCESRPEHLLPTNMSCHLFLKSQKYQLLTQNFGAEKLTEDLLGIVRKLST